MAAVPEQTPTIGTQIELETLRTLKAAGCLVGQAVMADKQGPGTQGNVQLTTNVYGLQMKQCDIYRYDVKISGIVQIRDDKQLTIEFTKKSTSDFIVADRRSHCRDALHAFEDLHRHDVIGSAQCLYYDLQAILYSTKKLNLSEHDGVYRIPPPKNNPIFTRYKEIIVEISSEKVVRMGDFSRVTSNLELSDRDLEQFLDIATSQWPSNTTDEHVTFSASSSYLLYPGNYGFCEDDICYFKEVGGYLAIGAQKAVRVIEGPQSGSSSGKSASVVVSTKKTPFHNADQSLSDKIKDMSAASRNSPVAQASKLSEQLKGIWAYTKYLKIQLDVWIRGISATTAVTQTFVIEDRKITIQDYFLEKHNITLKEPNLPLVESLSRDKKTILYFPSELLFVHDNQRIKTNQMPGSVTQVQIKKCAIAPGILREQNEKTVRSLHFWEGNNWLESAQIKIAKAPMSVNAHELAPPNLMAGNNDRPRVNVERGCTFQAKNFYTSGFIPKGACWVAYAFIEDVRDERDVTEDNFKKFIQLFIRIAKQRGLQLDEPLDWQVFTRCNNTIMEEKMRVAVENGTYFALCIHHDTSDMHHHIKLAERNLQLITQCVRVQCMKNVITKNQMLTMDNILNKTNVKLGGMNVVLQARPTGSQPETPLNPATLYIGLSSNHPGGGIGGIRGGDSASNPNPVPAELADTADQAPSVVGYSANYGPNAPMEFLGDFIYQPPRREEKVDVVQTIVQRCIQRYHDIHAKYPECIILFRNGVSDGMFQKILKYEVPLLKCSIKALVNKDIPLTVIISNKISQNVRFFKKEINSRDRGPDQNIRPGTVIDTGIVHPTFAEFYINSHKTLQGTAKTPKYTVLFDESKFSLSRLEGICYELCYGYQIVFFPVSLPVPVYIADQYAKRGRNLYKFHMTSSNVNRGGKVTTYTDLSNELSFYTSEVLRKNRVNA